jgi:CBS domain-containing protein
MTSPELKTGVKVKDIMSAPVITVKENDDIVKVAQLMERHEVGSVIVASETGDPVGIITERNILKRVAAKNLLPSQVKARDVMSRPLVTVDSNIDVTEAAKKMSLHEIRRLPVLEGGKLIGIVSSKDIVDVMPALIDVISEKSRAGLPSREGESLVGYCDRCQAWSDNLKDRDGAFICEDCLSDFEEEKKVH